MATAKPQFLSAKGSLLKVTPLIAAPAPEDGVDEKLMIILTSLPRSTCRGILR